MDFSGQSPQENQSKNATLWKSKWSMLWWRVVFLQTLFMLFDLWVWSRWWGYLPEKIPCVRAFLCLAESCYFLVSGSEEGKAQEEHVVFLLFPAMSINMSLEQLWQYKIPARTKKAETCNSDLKMAFIPNHTHTKKPSWFEEYLYSMPFFLIRKTGISKHKLLNSYFFLYNYASNLHHIKNNKNKILSSFSILLPWF